MSTRIPHHAPRLATLLLLGGLAGMAQAQTYQYDTTPYDSRSERNPQGTWDNRSDRDMTTSERERMERQKERKGSSERGARGPRGSERDTDPGYDRGGDPNMRNNNGAEFGGERTDKLPRGFPPNTP